MGKAALIAIAAFGAMSTVYSNSSKSGMLRASERVANLQYETIARSAAVNGFNLAKQALSESFASRTFKGRFDRATYGVEISVSGNRAVVISVGDVPNASGDDSSYRLQGEFLRETSAAQMADEVPPFMMYALISEDDLRVSGNAGAAVVHASGTDLNANFHTNGDLEVNGKGKERIHGFGMFAGSVSGEHRDTKFQPDNSDPDEPHCLRVPAVDIPTFDVSDYTRFATTSSSSMALSGSFAGGSREKPKIVLVNGDLDVGNVTIDGYVAFVVTGDIEIHGNARVGSSGFSGSDESSIGFYAGGDIDITGNTEVWAQLYSEGDFDMGGGADLYGSVTTRSEARLHGNPEFHYREASPALTTIWNGTPGGTTVHMTNFFER